MTARFNHTGLDGAIYAGVTLEDIARLAPTETLRAARIQKDAALSAECGAAIARGFSSNALGAAHLYPTAATDQLNLNASVTASIVPGLASDWTTPFSCADEAGVWARRPHTAAQIQQVGQDAKAHVLACLTSLDGARAALAAAASLDAIAAVSLS